MCVCVCFYCPLYSSDQLNCPFDLNTVKSSMAGVAPSAVCGGCDPSRINGVMGRDCAGVDRDRDRDAAGEADT